MFTQPDLVATGSQIFHGLASRAAKLLRNSGSRPRSANAHSNSLSVELLEPRTLLTTAPLGEQFVVAPVFSFESTPAAIVVHDDGAFTAAWESFEADGSGFGVYAGRFAADGTALSPTFQVNTMTLGEQAAPAIAGDQLGNVIVVWQSKGQDTDGFGIYGQWFDSNGVAVGSEFRINLTTTGDQCAPAVAIDGNGAAIVAWQSNGQDGDDWGIYYTRLDGVGDTDGTEILVNDSTLGIQQSPTVAAADNGKYVIGWEAIDPAGGADASLDIYAKLYGASGTPIAGEFRVNTETLRDQVTPQFAMDTNGDFVAVWVGGGIPGSGSDVFGQRFDEHGLAQGLQFRVNNSTIASQVGGTVSMDDAGNFLVAWQSVHQDGFSEGVYGKEYDAAGNTLVDEFLVNTTVEGPQSGPSAAMNGAGEAVVVWKGHNDEHSMSLYGQRFQVPNADPAAFRVGGEFELAAFAELEESRPAAAMDLAGNTIVAWESYGEDGDGLGIYAQPLDVYGDPVGSVFLVNAGFTSGNQAAPAVARAPDGRFVIVWQSEDEDGDGYGIYAQRYAADGTVDGGAFRVNTAITGNQMSPTVAMGEDGRFVVVWQGDAGDGTTNIYAQRFDGEGNAVGIEFQVNAFEVRDQNMPAVAMNAAGQFAIAWVSSHPAETIPEIDPEKSVFFQWYDASGAADGSEVLAHEHVKDAQESPAIALDAAGNVVLAWQSINQDGSSWGVYARQFRPDKTSFTTEEFQVNETTAELQRLVGLGISAEGHFVIAWENTSTDADEGSSTDIYRREYFADGAADGHENLVNNWTAGPQTGPVVARSATGNYGIFWLGQGFSHIEGVHGRLYDVNLSDDPGTPSRIPITDQFLVAETLGFENSGPAIAMNADGSFTAAFESYEEDGSGFGIFLQRFDADGAPIPDSRTQVNTTAAEDQSAPALASDGVGNVLVVWQSYDLDGYGIFGQWFSAAGVKVGAEFRVNSQEIGDQSLPDVALDASGRAIVTWQSDGQDGSGLGVYYACFESFATTGSELLATTTVIGDQQAPHIAAAANGLFVIAWNGPGPTVEDEASVEVFARRFGVDGLPIGAEFQVNAIVDKDQVLPDVAVDDAGNAVFVWQVEGQTGSGSDIYARRMDASGNLLGTDFMVNDTTERPQRSPSVAMDADGNFLVSWQSQYQDGYSWGIYGREYSADAAPLTAEFAVNERVAGPQTSPSVAANAAGQTIVAWIGNDSAHLPSVFGHRYQMPEVEPDVSVGGELLLANFVTLEETPPAAAMNANRESVVVWTSYAEDGSGMGVYAQLLDRYGAALGVPFLVNAVTVGNQTAPAVARAPDGRFVIAWQSEDEDGSGTGVYARRYAADGTPQGAIFQVNSTTDGDQSAPAIAIGVDGRFVIVWQSTALDGSLDIIGQRYLADGTAVGNEFRVNNFTGLDQKDPSIAMNSAGQFVVAWVSDHPALTNPEDTEKSVFVQWYDANGAANGDEVLIHRFVKDAQEAPVVGIDSTGRFVVAWQSINQDGNTWGVFARRFLADKTPLDRREFAVNETRQGPQRYLGLGVDEFGRFVISWQSNTRAELTGGGSSTLAEANSHEASSWDLYSRQYSFQGSPEGSEIEVNQYQMGPQIRPVVAQAPGGDFGIFWLGQGPDHIEGVHGRLYQSLFDFGDAPASYSTLLVNGGARHLPGSAVYLGGSVDTELEGQPNASATGDDADLQGDDENGVVLPGMLYAGSSVTIPVIASAAGKLDAWVDFNGNGVFEQSEQIAARRDVVAGTNSITFVTPVGAAVGSSYARFRISSAGGLSPQGAAADGEVEDYQVFIAAPLDPYNALQFYVVGPDAPSSPLVKVYDGAGNIFSSFYAFSPKGHAGVRVALGDVNGDKMPDVIVGTGAGVNARVRVYDGTKLDHLNANGTLQSDAWLLSFRPFEKTYRGGVYVAAGDTLGLGRSSIIVSAGGGRRGEVRIFDGLTGARLQSFTPYSPRYSGGVTLATADFNADGRADIVTGRLTGTGYVRIFDGVTSARLASFNSYGRFQGGVYVATADLNGNGVNELIVGADSGGKPRIRVFEGLAAQRIASITAYPSAFRGGVRVGAADIDGDGLEEILAAPGPRRRSEVKAFEWTGEQVERFFAYDRRVRDGIFVN